MSEGTIVLKFTIPTEWPPSVVTPVYRGVHDGSTISVEASTDATLRFTCVCGDDTHDFITPALNMPGFSSLKAAFAWGADGSMVAINGVQFSDEIFRLGEAVTLTSKDGQITKLREPLAVNIPNGLELAEERLMRSLIELQERIAKVDRVNLLEASAILRRLLLDAHPLVNRVNRKYKLKLRYPIAVMAAARPSDSIATYSYINLAPLFAPRESVVELSLDEFLSRAAVKAEKSYSVRDVIDYCANTKGGVHFDDPRSDASKELLELDCSHFPELVDASLHAIADLSWCVIQGVRPLVMKIESNYATA